MACKSLEGLFLRYLFKNTSEKEGRGEVGAVEATGDWER